MNSCYNHPCRDEQIVGALCFSNAAYFPQLNIVGKVPSACGLTSPAVHLDNGSAREGHFTMDRDWLYQKYIVEKLDCVQIGGIVHKDPKTVWHWLKKLDIPTRPRGGNYKQNLLQGQRKGFHHSEATRAKIRVTSAGKKPYLRNGVHFNKGKRGNVVWNWKGGVTPERQVFYRSDEWKAAVKIIWGRDDATCQRCGLDYRTVDRASTRKFHIHHIVSFAVKESRCDPANLVLVCHSCHMFIHSKRNVNHEFIQ